MSEQEGVTIPITAEDDFSEVFTNLQDSLNQFASEVGDASEGFSEISDSSDMATSSLTDLEAGVSDAGDSMSSIASDSSDLADSFSTMSDSLGTVSSTASDTTTSFSELSDTVESLSDSITSVSDSISSLSDSSESITSNVSDASDALSQLDDTATSSAEAVNQLSDDTNQLPESFDNSASSADNLTTSLQNQSEAASQVATSNAEASEAGATSGSSFRDSASSIAGTAGAMGALTMSAYGLNDAYVRLGEANETLQSAQNTLKGDQLAYNEAVEKFGPSSEQATRASLTLQNAQDSLQRSQQRVGLANEQVQMQWLMMATSTIPLLLTQLPEMASFLFGVGAEEDDLTASELAQAAASQVASGAMALFDAVMDANPIVLVVLAIAGLVAVLAYLTDGFKNFGPLEKDFNDAWKDLQVVFNDVVSFIKSDVYPVLDELYKTYIQPIITGINDVTGIGKDLSGGLSSLGKDVGIPGLASGGIVTQPTLAIIGEQGPEAVLPLSTASITAPTGLQALPSASNSTTSTSLSRATVNIYQNNNLASNLDVNSMTDQMSTKIAQELTQGY